MDVILKITDDTHQVIDWIAAGEIDAGVNPNTYWKGQSNVGRGLTHETRFAQQSSF